MPVPPPPPPPPPPSFSPPPPPPPPPPGISLSRFSCGSSILVELEFENVGFSGGRKTGEPEEKPSEQDENQQQTQPTLTPGRSRTQATLVGGERCFTISSEITRVCLGFNRNYSRLISSFQYY